MSLDSNIHLPLLWSRFATIRSSIETHSWLLSAVVIGLSLQTPSTSTAKSTSSLITYKQHMTFMLWFRTFRAKRSLAPWLNQVIKSHANRDATNLCSVLTSLSNLIAFRILRNEVITYLMHLRVIICGELNHLAFTILVWTSVSRSVQAKGLLASFHSTKWLTSVLYLFLYFVPSLSSSIFIYSSACLSRLNRLPLLLYLILWYSISFISLQKP